MRMNGSCVNLHQAGHSIVSGGGTRQVLALCTGASFIGANPCLVKHGRRPSYVPVDATAFRFYFRCDMFELVSDYEPAGDQPQAIAKLTDGILSGAKAPDAAGRHRFGQNVHRRQRHPERGQAHAGHLAQQNAGGAALRGVQKFFSATTRSNISSAISIITSPRPTSRARTRSWKRIRA